MSKNEDNNTLLKALLDCFKASQPIIKFVNVGKEQVFMPEKTDIIEWWKILFCKNIIALSIAPGSHDKALSKDALSVIVNHKVNSKNKSIVYNNFIPYLKGEECQRLIKEEITHLANTIDIGVRAAHSPWPNYTESIPLKSLKKSDEVQIFYDQAIRFLMQRFMDVPYEILVDGNNWFANAIVFDSESKKTQYTNDQALSILACALILGLNLTDLSIINKKIERFLLSSVDSNDSEGGKPTETLHSKSVKETIDSNEQDLFALSHESNNRANSFLTMFLDRIKNYMKNSLEALIDAEEKEQFEDAKSDIREYISEYIKQIYINYLPNASEDPDGEERKKRFIIHENWLKGVIIFYGQEVVSLNQDTELINSKCEFLNTVLEVFIPLEIIIEEIALLQAALELSSKVIEKERIQNRVNKLEADYRRKNNKAKALERMEESRNKYDGLTNDKPSL